MLQYLPLLLCPLSTRRLLSCIPVPIPVLGLLKVMCSYSGLAAPDCQTDCIQVLTAPEGSFWSPCYPRDYPKNQACRWTLQAPAGFIVQIAFLDFELEEALGCIYDRVVVSTGTSDVTFCGITANGLTLNSSGNIMEVSFSSDFSVQKRGFNISYRQVAVALRNQKVALPQNAAKVIQVSNQVSIPTLQQFTVCFEVARTTQKKGETIFLYTDPSGNTVSFGLSSSGNVMALTMDGQECALSAILSPASFTATMKLFCLSWSSLSGRLNLYVDNNIRVASCAATTGKTITGGGTFRLGDNSLSFDGTVYNFRMWNYAMSKTEFSTLTCDAIGNVIDWDNAFWNIPSGLAQTDSTYTFQALLKSRYTSSTTLQYSVIKERLVSRNQTLGGGLVLETASVQPLENCPAEESPFHYIWPETQPAVTQFLPCFPNKAQSASRTCNIYWQNFTSFWSLADVSNCTDIKKNAAEVAATLADITHNELSTDEVSTVVTKLKEIVIVSKMNSSLASTVVNVFSNVMTSSDTALAASSEIVLKTVEELVQKIEFDGPSLSITSRNLALGISAFNSSSFNGTSFSAYIPPNSTDLQINFESQQDNPLAAVTLPATLLSNVSQAEAELISRINFMFFRKTNLFQVQKYIYGFRECDCGDPQMRADTCKPPTCFCAYNGSGGWSSEGCNVGQGSDSNRTVCLCNHLTNFGILMDISGAAAQIDAQNNKILTFITYIGCGVSAICSAVTLLTYIAFEKLRRDYPSKILMNLSTSLLFLNMVFLIDSWLASFNNTDLCISVAFFLHYFLLTSFTWMGLESVHMYIALVKVFNTYIRRYILKFCIVGWGLPAAIVVTVVAVDRNSYGKEDYGKDEHGQGSSQFCWVKNLVVFYVTCVGYFSVIFLMNVAMFIVVMIQICGRNGKRSNRTLREEMLRSLRSVVSLTFLLGMTWGFAFFAWGPVNLAFMYLFSIFNSLQGLFIFIFHCALKENVQKQWQRYLCCGRFRLADNSGKTPVGSSSIVVTL
uniref:Adhesion G-protein coupled receptor G6 n=1 Tax=Scleropages formosus TaxID=113540 RepID=A0A8C9WPT8_SCLFO